MFELKLTFSTAEALYAAVSKLAGETSAMPVVTPLAAPEVRAAIAPEPAASVGATGDTKRKPGRPRKETAEAPATQAAIPMMEEKEEAEAAPVAEAEAPVADAPAAPAPLLPTGDDVKAAAEKLNATSGIVALKRVLAQFRAARISEIDPSDRAAFIEACGG